jgi:hypothetical protein
VFIRFEYFIYRCIMWSSFFLLFYLLTFCCPFSAFFKYNWHWSLWHCVFKNVFSISFADIIWIQLSHKEYPNHFTWMCRCMCVFHVCMTCLCCQVFLLLFISQIGFFWKVSVWFIFPFINWIIYPFAFNFCNSFYSLILILYLMNNWQNFSPIL